MVMSRPESKVRAAALGVEPDVELRRGRHVAETVAPAHDRDAPEAREQLGAQRGQQRDVRERPDGREQHGLVAALEHLGEQVDRVHRHDRRARFRQPARHRARRRRARRPRRAARHDQRPRSAGRDGDVLAPRQREHAQGVARRRLSGRLPATVVSAMSVDLRTRQGEQDRDRVVHAGIAVDDERRGHGRPV